jgi:hypothetical protein
MPTSAELANSLVSAAGSGDAADAALVVARLAVFPVAVLTRLQQNGTRVRACRNSITDQLVSLRGVQPRGWPPGSTWDIVPGIFNPPSNEVVIAVVRSWQLCWASHSAFGRGRRLRRSGRA